MQQISNHWLGWPVPMRPHAPGAGGPRRRVGAKEVKDFAGEARLAGGGQYTPTERRADGGVTWQRADDGDARQVHQLAVLLKGQVGSAGRQQAACRHPGGA